MANEYRLSFTAEEIDEKLNKVDNLTWSDVGNDKDGTVIQLDNKYLSILDCQEGDLKEFMPNTTATTSYNSAFQVYGIQIQSTEELFNYWHSEDGVPKNGSVFVEFDGNTHECVPQRIAMLNNLVAVGNCTAWGGTENGEPFAAIAMDSASSDGDAKYYFDIAILTDTTPTEHTARVYQKTPDKYMLKEEFLPSDAIKTFIDEYIGEVLRGEY